MSRIALEPEQEQLFETLVEAWRSVPRAEREEFMFLRTSGPGQIQGNGFLGEVLATDVDELVNAGLLAISNYHSRGSGFNFYIPAEALAYYGNLRRQAGSPVEQVEALIREYLESERFHDRP